MRNVISDTESSESENTHAEIVLRIAEVWIFIEKPGHSEEISSDVHPSSVPWLPVTMRTR